MKTGGRYEIRGVLGEGGMGIVYRAFDPVMNREVTLKTILNSQDKTAIDLFKRECTVLSSLAHPNIVEIYDIGEAEDVGGKRPYFVMPLLRGTTLDKLIKSSSTRLNSERSVQIMSQICRGLQAAHEQGLVHRDLKPSNIFILEDDSVKIIDFGVAHLMDHHTATGLKGTLLYMAPEQLQMKPPSPLSDQFSIGVVCYEMLAHRHPFSVPGYKDLTHAILNHSPVPICDVNQAVNRGLSQVVHKALAKQPVHRYSDVREFAECLQKGLRNEAIPIFDPSRLQPRLDRVRKAIGAGDLEFAGEIVRELQSESHIHPDIQAFSQQIDETKRRQTITQLLETAKRRFNEEEYLLALQKVQEILDIDSTNTDAFTLKGDIESKRNMAQIDVSLRLAQQHLENHAYDLARQAAERVLQLRPKDSRAQTLLAEAERREQESARLRQEKEKAYHSAIQFFGQGDLSGALSKMERVLDLERRSPEIATPEQSATYQKVYEEVRSKRDLLEAQYAEAKRATQEGHLTTALAICDEVLKQYPDNVVFHSLQYDIEEARREEISSYIAKVEKEVTAEPDLNRKVAILEAATQKYPTEERFIQSLARVKSRRDLVGGIFARAAAFENSGQFAEALSQLEILKNTYPQHPGLDVDIERVKHRREQQTRTEVKSHWIAQIDELLALNNFTRADSLANDALAEFKGDPELLSLKKSAQLGLKRAEEASIELEAGRQLLAAGSYDAGFAALREAARLDPHSQMVRTVFVDALLRRARELLDSDWRVAEPLVIEAQDLDPGNPMAKSLRTLLRDRSEGEDITTALSRARELQSQGEIREAVVVFDRAIEVHPGRERLTQLRAVMVEKLPENDRAEMRNSDLHVLKQLVDQSRLSDDPKELESIFAKTSVFASKYGSDPEFVAPSAMILNRVKPSNDPATQPVAIVTDTDEPGSRSLGREAIGPWLVRSTPGRAILGVIALSLLIVVFVKLYFGKKAVTPPAQPSTVALKFTGLTGDAQLLDAKGQNVLGHAASLPAGDYTLRDEKPGFRVRQNIIVNPAQGVAQTLAAKWIPLVPVFSIHSPVVSGQWSLDGRPVVPEQLGKLEAPLTGKHELTWSDAGLQIKLPFTVLDGLIELDKLTALRAPVLAVSLGPGDATLKLSNLKIRYQAGSSPGEADSDRIVPLGSSDVLNIEIPGETEKLKIGPYDPEKGGVVAVWFKPPGRTPVYRQKPPDPKKENTITVEPSPVRVPPIPPELTPQQKKEQELGIMGLSPDVIKKKEDKK